MPASVVYQAIEPAVIGYGGVYQLFDFFNLRNIARNKVRLAWAGFSNFGSERRAFGLMPRAEDHLRPCRNERFDTTFANPFAAAGADRHFVFVFHEKTLFRDKLI